MKDFLKSLFEYHHELNNRIIEVYTDQYDKITPEMHRLFCHMLNAHQIWNARILEQPAFKVFQLHDPKIYKSIEGSNVTLSLSILETRKLTEMIRYHDSRGNTFVNTLQEILFHITNHHTHHRGQLMKMFRNGGMEPLITDYIYYTRRPFNSG